MTIDMKNTTKKVVLICYADDDWKKNIPFSDPEQRQSYEALYELAEVEFSLQVVRASLRWFNGKQFTKYWEYSKGQWKKVNRAISPDCVLVRCVRCEQVKVHRFRF